MILFCSILTTCSTVLLTGSKLLLLVSDSELLTSSFQIYKQFIDSVPASTNKVSTELLKKVDKKMATVVESYFKCEWKIDRRSKPGLGIQSIKKHRGQCLLYAWRKSGGF